MESVQEACSRTKPPQTKKGALKEACRMEIASPLHASEKSDTPPEKLLAGGLSTPVPPFCLFCTIISNKTCILD